MAQEKNFENRVKKFLKEENCWYLKTWGGGMQRSGIPDLLICCGGFFLAVELKSEDGRGSELQAWNIKIIDESGGISIVLRPNQFERFKKLVRELKKEGARMQ